MGRTRTLVALLCAAALAGCDGPATELITGPDVQASFSHEAVASKNQMVWGKGILRFSDSADEFSFHAKRQRDLDYHGTFWYRVSFTNAQGQRTAIEYGGDIQCFAISGNKATVTGIVRRSNSPVVPVGSAAIWNVTDNGKDPHGTPDTASPFGGIDPATALAYCHARAQLLPEEPVERGHIRIKD